VTAVPRTGSAAFLWAASWGFWLVLLAQQALDAFVREAPWIIWVAYLLPLLIFLPGMLRDRLRSYVWLCFVALLYFVRLVERLFAEPGALPPIVGMIAVVVASWEAGSVEGVELLSILRGVTSALFLGVLSDAMLLGHWYLVQPGLARAPILEQVRWAQILWVPETIVFVIPTGMWSVLNGDIDDAYNGLLGWFWVASVLGTGALILVCRLALKERQYSAVMAATGLMYLAILTGFGQDIVARVLLSP